MIYMDTCNCPDCGCKTTETPHWYEGHICAACYNSKRRHKVCRGRVHYDNPLERWLKIDKWTLTDKGCWESHAHLDPDGYPRVAVKHRGGIKLAKIVLEDKLGSKVPSYLETFHYCNNRKCVNPSHLKADTHTENIKERDRSGGTKRGSENHMSKLTEEDVYLIRNHYIPLGYSDKQIAVIYGVKRQTINDIRNKRRWKHLQSSSQ